jgi:hypothetical protein
MKSRSRTPAGEPLEQVEVPAACSLSPVELREQRERYARLARGVSGSSFREGLLRVELSPSFDRTALEELIAVERECCPFFRFTFAPERRTLEIGVASPEHEPALAAIAHGLGITTEAR